jgi:hypothetical protein
MKQIYKQLRTVITVMLLCIAPVLLFGQSKIGGTVTDDKKLPLPGVSVTLKGSTKGTVTDINGGFLITAEKGQVLVFKFLGFVTQELTVGDQANYNVILADDSKVLNEVVVTALGIKRETKRLGYSVQELNGAEVTKAREPNAINGLTGKISGLNVGINQEILAAPTGC